MDRLGVKESIALGVLKSRPFWAKEGRAYNWSVRVLQPVFDRLAEEVFMRTITKCSLDPKFKGRTAVISLHDCIKGNEFRVEGSAETGLVFSGTISGIFANFHFEREVGIL